MSATTLAIQPLAVPWAPAIPGLVFRRFRGEADYAAMHAVIEGSKEADGIERSDSVEDIARNYQYLTNSDPSHDMVFVQVNGDPSDVVGYGRVFWEQEQRGDRLYQHFANLLPSWRGIGIRRAMLRHNERRLREVAAGHEVEGRRIYQAWAADTEEHWANLLEGAGYHAVRTGHDMVRPTLDEVPDCPLPAGLEVRPVREDQVETIWLAAAEAFRDHWAETEWQPEWLEEWRQSPTFDVGLWQVAWAGDQVAGGVLNFVNREENEEYGRQRGYTEGIFVRRPWRRQGVAKALIARSFHMHRELGMTEAALGVDSQNPNGAFQLYQFMGFRVVKSHTVFRKPMD